MSESKCSVVNPNEDARMKTFMFRLFTAVLFVMINTTLWFQVRKLVFDLYDIDHERPQAIINLVNNMLLIATISVCLVYLNKVGVTTGLQIVVLTVPLWYSIVFWLNDYTANIFHFTILALDVNIALAQVDDCKWMHRLSVFVMFVSTCAVTVDLIDERMDGGLHIHFWGRTGSHGVVLEWFSFTTPMGLTFILLRNYVEGARDQEQRAVHAVEVAYQIADKLANYDLDSAEKLLIGNDIKSFDGQAHIQEPLSQLLANLRSYSPFLPHSLFSEDAFGDVNDGEPNKRLRELIDGKETSQSHVETAVRRIRDLEYSLTDFHADMVAAYPELQLYYGDDETTTSGLKGVDEYQRTLGALYTIYSLVRLDLDGKDIFSFGIDDDGCPRREPTGSDADAEKKRKFYHNMRWDDARDLVKRAGILLQDDDDGKIHVRPDRLSSMLALTAIHDVMKNNSLTPTVQARHSPYRGYASNEQIGDHDVALEYVLEHFPTILPSFKVLEPGQRVPILFTQGKMGFNNGWLVQGEAPPGALFARFKQVIMEGRASQSDINFYFLHWLTDLAGAEPFHDRPWPGAEKFTAKFPVAVLSAFLDSWGFVEYLASGTEVEVMEDYLISCWNKFGPPPIELPLHYGVAAMRLALMAQGFEHEVVAAFSSLTEPDRELLAEELARTGRREQFRRAPAHVQTNAQGPALLIYYSPALVQKGKADQCAAALQLLAAVFRAARYLFPLGVKRIEETVTVRIDALKVLTPKEILDSAPWHLRRTSGVDAEAGRGTAFDSDCSLIPMPTQELEDAVPLEMPSSMETRLMAHDLKPHKSKKVCPGEDLQDAATNTCWKLSGWGTV